MFRPTSIAISVGLSLCLAGAAYAQQVPTVYIGMNGGTLEQAYVKHVFPEFEKLHKAKVVVVPGTSSDILAKVQASKEKPVVHVMHLDDGVMVRAMGMGLCQKTNDSATLKELYPSAIMSDRMAVGVSVTTTGIGYNKKLFDEKKWAAPTSWMDFADPKYKGKVVFQSVPSSSFGLHGFLMFNRIQGGTEKNVEPGFNAWKNTIGPNVLEYIPSSAKLSEMVQTNDAAIFPLTPTSVAAQKARGIPMEYAQPKEGSVILMVAQCVTANNDQPELAQKLAEFLLAPMAQSAALDQATQIPTNQKATATSAAAKDMLQAFVGYMKNAVTLDWGTINQQRPEWNSRWSRTIEK
jgi:putative spermidine/putrescine transport system substrate-binding protein